MEERFKEIAEALALAIESGAVLLVAFGAIEAFVLTLWRLTPSVGSVHKAIRRREIWMRFAVWLLLGLEFELAADIIRSAIAPSWSEIGQLAAIAAIRTGLNYSLEHDIAELSEHSAAA